MLMLLTRLTSGDRLGGQINLFHQDMFQCSRIINYMINWLFTTWAVLLMRWNVDYLRILGMEEMAAAGVRRGSRFDNVIFLIDSTQRRIGVPEQEQRRVSIKTVSSQSHRYQVQLMSLWLCRLSLSVCIH